MFLIGMFGGLASSKGLQGKKRQMFMVSGLSIYWCEKYQMIPPIVGGAEGRIRLVTEILPVPFPLRISL